MYTDRKVMLKLLLEALSDAGLCVCERYLIESHHPGLITDTDRIIRRIDEHSRESDNVRIR